MIHQQVNWCHAVHLHRGAKPEKVGTEREQNEMVQVFKEYMNVQKHERISREGLQRKNRLDAKN